MTSQKILSLDDDIDLFMDELYELEPRIIRAQRLVAAGKFTEELVWLMKLERRELVRGFDAVMAQRRRYAGLPPREYPVPTSR